MHRHHQITLLLLFGLRRPPSKTTQISSAAAYLALFAAGLSAWRLTLVPFLCVPFPTRVADWSPTGWRKQAGRRTQNIGHREATRVKPEQGYKESHRIGPGLANSPVVPPCFCALFLIFFILC
jgi:hypothetical protein